MAELLSSRKRKRNQVELEEEASSGGSCGTPKSEDLIAEHQRMDLRRADEQRLFTEVLRTIAVPRVNNEKSWLCIDLWTTVTHEYNRRANEAGVPQRIMTSLIQLGRRLQFCHCRRGEQQHCSCIVPQFPVIDGPGGPSSHVSLGSGSIRVSEYPSNEVTRTLDYISRELERLRKVKKFTYENLVSFIDAWEHELCTGVGQSRLFMNSNCDNFKMKISKIVLKRQNGG